MTVTTQIRGTYASLIAGIAAGRQDVDALVAALDAPSADAQEELARAADAVRRSTMGAEVQLRALIEFSSHCSGSCAYCGLRAANLDLPRYRMEPEEIVETALEADRLGYRTIVLQSGEDAWYEADTLAGIVRSIRSFYSGAVTLCVGEREEWEYALWREAGADRYLLRIETSDPELYANLHPGMSFAHRVACLRALRGLDYEVGSGVLVGLPGQTLETLARDLLFLVEHRADMVGIGPFIPHPATPLADSAGGTVDLTLRMMALTRLLLPRAHIVSTTALGSMDPLGRERGLQSGGNVVMPNVTPCHYRAFYEIYPSKICLSESAEQCRGCIARRPTCAQRSRSTTHSPSWCSAASRAMPTGGPRMRAPWRTYCANGCVRVGSARLPHSARARARRRSTTQRARRST